MMHYPLISEYIESILNAEDNFDKLAYLRPILDANSNPVMSSGNFAVVFKMTDGKKDYAIKCFTKEQEGRTKAYQLIAEELEDIDSSYVMSIKYFEKELFVDCSCEEDEFSILLMDWIEGETTDRYIAEKHQDRYAMSMLCYRFCKMASWLRIQRFAHGDLKPDNIMVRPDGNLTLVDYDGMFVPAMKGQKSPTIGTKNYSHPLRTINDFNETIDDFALASIALSLKAVSLKPSLYTEYCVADSLLFSAEDYLDLSKSKAYGEMQDLLAEKDVAKLLSLFLISLSEKDLSMCSHRLFGTNKPKKINNREIEKGCIFPMSTKVTQQELDDAIIDEYGVKYSKDGKKLLEVPETLNGLYSIKEGTQIVGDDAFGYCKSLTSIDIPSGVTSIGDGAFYGCRSLSSIKISYSVTSIGDNAFYRCSSLKSLEIPDCVISMNGNPFRGWLGILKIRAPYFYYENGMLINKKRNVLIAYCSKESACSIPNGVICIGKGAFAECQSLVSIEIPKSVTSIEDSAFYGCTSLSSITIPDGVKSIGDSTFYGCESLSTIEIPDSVISIGKNAFYNCTSLIKIAISANIKSISRNAFYGCTSLSPKIKNEIEQFGNDAWGHRISNNLLEEISKIVRNTKPQK